LSNAAQRAPHLAALGNVRGALAWCFGGDGDPRVGVELAAAVAPVFLAMSLLAECRRWSERAVCALDDVTRGGAGGMHLQMALGMSSMFARGHGDAACAALNRSFRLEAIRRVEVNGDLSCMPEPLRVKGRLLLARPQPAGDDAERCFLQSLELSRRQGMRAWELRTAVDLATLLAARGRTGHGRTLLRSVLQPFTEGWSTANPKAARQLLAAMG
jgi:predicted ATPase